MLPLNLVSNTPQRPRKCLRYGPGWALESLEGDHLRMVLPSNKCISPSFKTSQSILCDVSLLLFTVYSEPVIAVLRLN